MSLTRRVTSELKKQIWPIVVEWGFDDVKGRTATRVEGPQTAIVEVASLSKRNADVIGVPTSSFSARIGLSYIGSQPASFMTYEPYVPDIAQTRIGISLSKSVKDSLERSDIWVIDDEESLARALFDLADALRTQGRPFLNNWSDLDRGYELLLNADESSIPGSLGKPELTFPGNPGSLDRLDHLAVFASLRGDREAEIVHLRELVNHRHGGEEKVARYLEQLESNI